MVFYLFCNGISFLTGFFIVFAVFVVFSWYFLNIPRSEFRSGVVGASPFIKKHYKCAPRRPSRLRGIFFLNPLLKTITNVPLGALRVHEAFFFQSLIKHQYKLDPGSPSRLRGTFLLNPLLKLITNAPLGPLRVYGASSFETPYKRNKKETSKVHLQNHPFWTKK